MSQTDEASIRAAFEAGDLDLAATRALEAYGPELLGYLVATLRSDDHGAEVFAEMSVDLWRGLPAFEWRSQLKTWLYRLAHNAAARYRSAPVNQRRRRQPLSQISEVAERVRTRTLPYLRTDVKDRFAALREALSPDDQSLLILRVDRGMSWSQVAGVYVEGPGEPSAEELARTSARLRKRFGAIKERLRELAQRDGLLAPS